MGLRPIPRAVPYRGSAPGPRRALDDSRRAPAKTRPRLHDRISSCGAVPSCGMLGESMIRSRKARCSPWRSGGAIVAAACMLTWVSCGRVTLDFPGQDVGPNPIIDAATDEGEDIPDGSPTTCAAGKTRCLSSCVSLASDPLHCGACGHRCDGLTPVCDVGECRPACTGGLSACAGACVDLKSDPDHCGDCSVVCTNGTQCNRSACDCLAGQILCGRRCVDTSNDRSNCGACGRGCPAASVCGGGVCK
jgi:hypothetical protein